MRLRKYMANASALSTVVNAVKLDGTNDYLTRGGALTGVADSSTGVFSCWFRPDGTVSGNVIVATPSGSFRISHSTIGSTISVELQDSGGSNYLWAKTANSYAYPSAQWYHILISWNTNAASGTRTIHLYINDVSDKTVFGDVGSAFVTKYVDTNFYVSAPSGKVDGCLSELYFAPGQFLDFSVTANRRKFIDANGKPVSLGSDGSTPTGTAPAIYLKGDKTNFGTNAGTGGNFTVNGALEAASTSPSDASINAVKYDGSTSYLTRGGALTGVVDSPTGIISFFVREDSIDSNYVLQNTGGAVSVIRNNSDGKIAITVSNGGSSFKITSGVQVGGGTAATGTSAPVFFHVIASWNTNFAAGSKIGQMYVRGVNASPVLTDASSAFNVAYASGITEWAVGATTAGTSKANQALSELYFAPGQYLDLSVAANLAKFIDSNGNPVPLGTDGSLPTGTAPAIYLNNRAALAHINKGTGGNFTANGTLTDATSTPLYYYANPTKFDGATTCFKKTTALTGISNGTQGTISCWIRLDASASFMRVLDQYQTADNFFLRRNSSNQFDIQFGDGTGKYLNMTSVGVYPASAVWVHVIASWDVNFAAGAKKAQMYIQDISDVSVTDATVAFTIPYTATTTSIGTTSNGGGSNVSGAIADLWFHPAYIDLSVVSNRRKFISANKNPIPLGAKGELPLGVQPLLYIGNPAANVEINLGSGGAFTRNGTIAAATTSPSDVRA